jgi:phenyl-phosphate phosphatase/carboxylase subunit beta
MATVMAEQKQRVGYASLREFLAAIDERKQVQRIAVEVDKDWEVGAICREVSDREGPAVLFEKVGKYKTPLLVNTLGTRERYALALGVEPSVEAIAARWKQAYAKPIKYDVVERSAAPCKEVVIDQPDLLADPFPVPKWHHLDGGCELGTLHGVVSMDPDTGWINVGTYRNEIFDSKRMGCYVVEVPYRHIHQHVDKWKTRGNVMPVAVVIGPDPYVSLTGVSAVPPQVDEYNIAGGLRGAPIEVVKAELSDLLVPAHAEIIIEGEMPLDKFWPTEGPFGEFTGYMGHEVHNSFYINVKKVTHRKDPIFHGTYEGRPPNESTQVRVVGRSAAVMEHLKRAGLVGIKDLCVTAAGCAGFHVNVSIKKSYPGHVRDVMLNLWGMPILYVKHVTVVDEDIDPWSPFMVEWAIATRVQADRDVTIVPGGKSVMLDPSQPGSRRGESALLGIDATKPLDEYRRDGSAFPASTDPLPEDIERVRRRWRDYGFRT